MTIKTAPINVKQVSMNKISTLLILCTLQLFAVTKVSGQFIKAMSYNIKYDNVNDTVNNWNDRKTAMVDLLKKHDPAFIGMQEVLFNQLEFLDTSLPSYNYIGVGRDDGGQKGEFSPIFFDTKKYKLLNSNTFWLSKTPEKISIGWDAALERICTYGLFEDLKNRQKVWVFNTHFDHVGVRARKKSVKLILRKINEINSEKFPILLMGDLNLTPDQAPIQLLQRKIIDGLSVSKNSLKGPLGTFNNFETGAAITRRIDYIFVKGFKVQSYEHVEEYLMSGKHVSDHLPVLISIHTQ